MQDLFDNNDMTGLAEAIKSGDVSAKEVLEFIVAGIVRNAFFVSARSSPSIHNITKVAERPTDPRPDLAITENAYSVLVRLGVLKHLPLAAMLCRLEFAEPALVTQHPCDRIPSHLVGHLRICKPHNRHIDAGLLPLLGTGALTQDALQVRKRR